MGTIVKRTRKNGSVAWLAQIVIKRGGRIVLRENKTFERRSTANAWIASREDHLAEPGVLETRLVSDLSDKRLPTLSDAIDRYIQESNKKIGRTKTQVLKSIKDFDIADKPCASITSTDIVTFAREKLDTGVQPQTVSNYLSHLGAVFAIARPAWSYPLDRQAMQDAWIVADRLGLTTKSKERDRRPTLDELDRLMQHFQDRSIARPSCVPMHRVIAFAIFSTRRQEEISRITWKDLDKKGSRICVRDMKNPGQKAGNDVWCDLQDEALAIIQAMPKAADQIFPYNTDAISASFTRACKLLGINDLRFHDLRHDGVSRLFELGLNIPRVASNSGHRSWTSLKRYTHLRQTGDKYEDWKWLPEVTKKDPALRLVRNGQLPRRRRSERANHTE
ncbi:MAG: site-specific integrase [Devosiaceae bacterium]